MEQKYGLSTWKNIRRRGNGVREIIEAVKTGKISESKLNNIVDRIINIAKKGTEINNRDKYDKEQHHKIAEKIAEECIVLLKNEEHILPLHDKKIALIGDMVKYSRYQGAGSSTINPYKIGNAYDNFKENNIIFDYAKGYERIETKNGEKLLNEAINIAKKNEIAIVFVGLTENFEAEGVDRESLNIPENQNRLIEEIYKVNKNIIVVLSNGAPIAMPWKDKVKAIITGYLGGEAGARAMVNCILGKVNPSGKLAETYPEKLEDTPCYKNYPGTELTVEYQESIYVGYRFYNTNNINVLFPFGYGLSYTQFEYSNLKVNKKGNEIEISFKIKNIGNMKGKEIAQIYISQENSSIFKPKKELKEFEKVELDVNEEKEIKIVLSKKAFEYYNPETFKWSVEQGKYKILIGKSSKDIVLEKEIFIESKDKNIEKQYPKKYYTGSINEITDSEFEKLLGRKIPNRNLILAQINEENTLEQIKETKIGKYIYENQIEKMKKLLTSIIILAIILASSTVVLGAEGQKSFNINLSTQTKTVNPGSEIEVVLNVSNFAGFETSGIIAYVANLEYDKNIFEEVQQTNFSSKGTWSSPTYNSTNMAMVSDSNTEIKTDSEIFGLKLKVKDGVAGGTKTTIKVTNFKASEGEEDIDATSEASIEIAISSKTSDETNKGDNTNKGDDANKGDNTNKGDDSNNGNNSGNQVNNNNNKENNSANQANSSNNSGTNKNNNSNSATGKLPQTGELDWIILGSGCLIAILGIVFYIKYKRAY